MKIVKVLNIVVVTEQNNKSKSKSKGSKEVMLVLGGGTSQIKFLWQLPSFFLVGVCISQIFTDLPFYTKATRIYVLYHQKYLQWVVFLGRGWGDGSSESQHEEQWNMDSNIWWMLMRNICHTVKQRESHNKYLWDIGNSSCDRELSQFPGSPPTIKYVFTTNQSINPNYSLCWMLCRINHKSSIKSSIKNSTYLLRA